MNHKWTTYNTPERVASDMQLQLNRIQLALDEAHELMQRAIRCTYEAQENARRWHHTVMFTTALATFLVALLFWSMTCCSGN